MTETIPIILLVSERSGSNLLRTLINNHPEICAPVAPHLMNEFYSIRKYYGDLRKEANGKNLLEDMLVVANHPYHNWTLDLDADNSSASATSVVRAFDVLYSEKAKQEKKIHYCSKGIHSFDFIDSFRSELRNVKFVHLVRDPRDHVASWMKRPIGLFTPYDAASKWAAEQEVFIDAITSRGLDCLSIKYENLIGDTASVMTKVQEYVGVDVSENCFSTNEGNVEASSNPYWKNLSKPIMSENKEKYKKELSEEDILVVESIARRAMDFFGYEIQSGADWTPDARYLAQLRKRRQQTKASVSGIQEDRMNDLRDRRQAARSLKSARKAQWESSREYVAFLEQRDLTLSQSVSPKQALRNRARHLAYALLGYDTAKKLSRVFKSS